MTLKKGFVFLPLTLEHEHDVVGVQVAGRLEVLVGMPLGVLAQVEGVDRAVSGDVPLLGEAGDDLRAAALEVDDVVVDLLGRVEGRAGGVDAGIEVLRAALGAIDEGFGSQRSGGQEGRNADGCEKG